VTLSDDKLGAITLSVGTLTPGGQTTVTAPHVITASDVDAGGITNVATAVGLAPNGASVTDTDTVTVELPQRPGLALDKSADLAEAALGDVITYTYVLTNTGNVTLSDLSLFDDKIPDPILSSTVGRSLGAGESLTLTAIYRVTAADVAAGQVVNVAVASGTPPSSNIPNEAEDTVTVPIGETVVQDTGFLVVSKQVIGTHEDNRYDYGVECEGIALGRAGGFSLPPRGGEREVGVAVPVGTDCTVTETDDGGADSTSVVVGDGRSANGRSARVTISEGTNIVTFTNTFDLAPISVPQEPTLPATGANVLFQLLVGFGVLSLGGTLVRVSRPRPRKGWLRA
jgi:uncharacterized repeat protein (TIGR01451 family)